MFFMFVDPTQIPSSLLPKSDPTMTHSGSISNPINSSPVEPDFSDPGIKVHLITTLRCEISWQITWMCETWVWAAALPSPKIFISAGRNISCSGQTSLHECLPSRESSKTNIFRPYCEMYSLLTDMIDKGNKRRFGKNHLTVESELGVLHMPLN